MLRITRHNTAAGDVSWLELDEVRTHKLYADLMQLNVEDFSWALQNSGLVETDDFSVTYENASKADADEDASRGTIDGGQLRSLIKAWEQMKYEDRRHMLTRIKELAKTYR